MERQRRNGDVGMKRILLVLDRWINPVTLLAGCVCFCVAGFRVSTELGLTVTGAVLIGLPMLFTYLPSLLFRKGAD